MAKTKPTVVPVWIPDNTTNIADPGAKATAGYDSTDPVPYGWLNYHLNRVGQWMQYANRQVDVHLYVNGAAGNDTTGDGSAALPYATVEKALTECGENSAAYIECVDATTQVITTDHDLKNQSVFIFLGGILRFNTKAEAGPTVGLCGFDMSKSAVTIVAAIEFASVGVGSTFNVVAAAFRPVAGKSTLNIFGTVKVTTGAGAIGSCYLVQNSAGNPSSIDLYLYGGGAYITTSSQNYIVDNAYGITLYAYGGDAAIDDTDYWVKTQTSTDTIWEIDFTKNVDTFASYACVSGLRQTGASQEVCQWIDYMGTVGAISVVHNANVAPATWTNRLNANTGNYHAVTTNSNSYSPNIAWTVTLTESTDYVTKCQIKQAASGIAGSKYAAAGAPLRYPFPARLEVEYIAASGDKCIFTPYVLQWGERNPGLVTNIESLK